VKSGELSIIREQEVQAQAAITSRLIETGSMQNNRGIQFALCAARASSFTASSARWIGARLR
jgi:hypothetical protein